MAQTEQIFANNFWVTKEVYAMLHNYCNSDKFDYQGLKDDGFHVLTAKMNSTKKTFDEIKSFYSVRY